MAQIKWIKNSLTDRDQHLIVNRKLSVSGSVFGGICRDCFLALCYFNIFINDLKENTKLSLIKFADDTEIGGMVHNEEDRSLIQSNIASLVKWVQAHNMYFKTAKCKCTHLGKKKVGQTYRMWPLPK